MLLEGGREGGEGRGGEGRGGEGRGREGGRGGRERRDEWYTYSNGPMVRNYYVRRDVDRVKDRLKSHSWSPN